MMMTSWRKEIKSQKQEVKMKCEEVKGHAAEDKMQLKYYCSRQTEVTTELPELLRRGNISPRFDTAQRYFGELVHLHLLL